jgi:hypothetical protein
MILCYSNTFRLLVSLPFLRLRKRFLASMEATHMQACFWIFIARLWHLSRCTMTSLISVEITGIEHIYTHGRRLGPARRALSWWLLSAKSLASASETSLRSLNIYSLITGIASVKSLISVTDRWTYTHKLVPRCSLWLLVSVKSLISIKHILTIPEVDSIVH